MGMTPGHPRTPATQANKRPRWVVGGATILTFVALLYLVELIDQLSGHPWTPTASGRWRPTACGGSSSPRCCTPMAAPGRQHRPDVGAGISDDAGRIVPIRLGHRDRLDPRRFRHLADRQLGQHLRPDRSHRRLGPDLRLAGLPAGVRDLRPPVCRHRHRAGGVVRLRRRAARRRAGTRVNAAACPGRATCAVPSPAWWRRTCCPPRNARPERVEKPAPRRRD